MTNLDSILKSVDITLLTKVHLVKAMVFSVVMYGTTDWFQIGKRVRQGCILSPCLFNFYAEYIMRDWRKYKLESRLPGEISITSDMQMTPPLLAESEEELRILLMKVKEESEKAG